jgi:hypothetical protein
MSGATETTIPITARNAVVKANFFSLEHIASEAFECFTDLFEPGRELWVAITVTSKL